MRVGEERRLVYAVQAPTKSLVLDLRVYLTSKTWRTYMSLTVKQMIEAANAMVPKIDMTTARAKMASDHALVVDVRDAPEVAKTGRVAGALHVSRGMLEFRADPDSPYHDENFRKDRPVIVYCASGGRSALAGKVLKEMGYLHVFNLGAFKDWAESGGEIDQPIEPGM